MNLRCLFGHDWEVVGYGNIYREFDWGSEKYSYNYTNWGTRSKKKVCLRCGKCIDEEKIWEKIYQDKLEEDLKKRKEKLNRQQFGKKLWESCAKRGEV